MPVTLPALAMEPSAEAEIGGDEEQHEDRDDEALLPPGGAQLELRHSELELS